MGSLRFRKSVKLGPGVRVNFSKSGISTTIGPRGFTTTVGSRGVYRNVSIPGTGISYRTKVGGSSSARDKTPVAVREWQSYTGEANPGVELDVDEQGGIVFFDREGNQITDQDLISIIKRTPQYKSQLPVLKERQRAVVADIVEKTERNNESFLKIFRLSPQVANRQAYEQGLSELRLQRYEPREYAVPQPVPEGVRTALVEEADNVVKGLPWKRKRLKEQYVEDRFQTRFDEAVAAWESAKREFDQAEEVNTEQRNREFEAEFDQAKRTYELALAGDPTYIEQACEEWISLCELPVEIDTQFEYRETDHSLMVDLDLPEIEDLPSETSTQLANGALKVKTKTQKALRFEYAECVFGLMIYVAACLFSVSPVIDRIVISGYTQRRNKAGDMADDYILSIKFDRAGFYGIDFEALDPEEFCFGFENRCKLTATKMFKTIEPYE